MVLGSCINVSQICRYVGCVRVDLLFFSIWWERSARTAFFDTRTCPHIGSKLACRRPGTKYCVDLFFQNPLQSFLLPLGLRLNFSPRSLFLCQCSHLPVRNQPPPTLVSIARQRAVHCQGCWRLRRCCCRLRQLKVLRMNQEGLVFSQGGWDGFIVG
jgi:hypothetical protein